MLSVIFYLVMGVLFTYLAINNGDDTIWGLQTILPAAIATFDFGFAIRLTWILVRSKQGNN